MKVFHIISHHRNANKKTQGVTTPLHPLEEMKFKTLATPNAAEDVEQV